MSVAIEEVSDRRLLIERIKVRLVDEMGQYWFNPEQQQVLNGTPTTELEPLLEELRSRFTLSEGIAAKTYFRDRIYTSSRQRWLAEQRAFDAQWPPQEPM